ncbi:MAG: hypothetical protein JWO74_1073 [Solirubrobacterales bacterium]|jgi:hypothetical protein|nr:hypothetical protein [Solirubrobacterales bacterium]
MFGATELGTVVAARQHHAPGATGVLLALWGAGSIVAGLAAVRWPVRRRVDVQLVAFLSLIGVATAALVAAPSLWLAARRRILNAVRDCDPRAAVAATDAHLAEVADTPLVRGADAA